MDEITKKENVKKEIIATVILIAVWIISMVIFAFVAYDFMYLIITSGLFIFSLVMLIYYLRQMRKINLVINKYRDKSFVAENIQEVLIRDYYRFCLDDEIEKNRDISCYSSLVDKVITLELESKHYLLYIKIENNEVNYAVSALDDSFYKNVNALYELTQKEEFSEDYFAKVDGDEVFVLKNKDTVYEELNDFIDKKLKQVNHLFDTYNENLKLLEE